MKTIYTILFVLIISILSSYTARVVNVKKKSAPIISKIENNAVDCQDSPDYTAGYDAGHLIGYNQGVLDGTIAGKGSLVCYNAGYNYGFRDGSMDGYDVGYDDGYGDGDGSSLTQKTNNNNKISVAANTANSDCYNLGFANGQSDGHTTGYSVGYNAEAEKSFSFGYDLGYDEGFTLAYGIAYHAGFLDGDVKFYNPHYNPNDYPDKYPEQDCNLMGYVNPVLNSTDFTTFYQSDSYSANDVVGLSPGSSGANQTWDFSGLSTLTFDGTFSVVPVASTPYAITFPTANFVFKSVSTGNPDYYSYYKTSSTTFESVSGADNTNIDLEIDHSTLFQFPYTYNTVINDTYQYVGDVVVSSFTSKYDGYGTLTTPYGTYTNVIRQKKVEVDGDITYTDYLWFTTSPFKLIMVVGSSVSSTDSGNYVNLFGNFTPLGVTAYNKEKTIIVYPNPTTSILNLKISNDKTIDKVVIVDITGKSVLQQRANATQVYVEKLAKGLYIIEAYSGNEKFTSKFVKQ